MQEVGDGLRDRVKARKFRALYNRAQLPQDIPDAYDAARADTSGKSQEQITALINAAIKRDGTKLRLDPEAVKPTLAMTRKHTEKETKVVQTLGYPTHSHGWLVLFWTQVFGIDRNISWHRSQLCLQLTVVFPCVGRNELALCSCSGHTLLTWSLEHVKWGMRNSNPSLVQQHLNLNGQSRLVTQTRKQQQIALACAM